MITSPRCVDLFPFLRENLYDFTRVTVFTLELEIRTNKIKVHTLTNGTCLTQFEGL
jgi:hypothetical protein